MNTDVVRAAFREDAQLAGPPPTDVYESVVARRRKSDRRRVASLAIGLTVALIAVAVPVGISLVGVRDAQVAGPAPIPDVDVFAKPTRGSLAGDTRFMDGVLQLGWAVAGVTSVPTFPEPPIESRHVVFAGDVAAGRWALVAGANTAQPAADVADPERQSDPEPQSDLGAMSDIAVVWFVGPAGASPEQMQPANLPRGIPADMPVSLYDGASGALVVVAARGDVIEVSARPEVAADGTVSRIYTDTGSSDGVAVKALEPNPYASAGVPAVQYRVTRADVVIAEQFPDGSGAWQQPPTVPLEYLRTPGAIFPDLGDGADVLATEILGEYALGPDEVVVQVHYVGPLPGPGGDQAALTVVTVTLPSGAVVVRAQSTQQVSTPDGPDAGPSYMGGTCVDEILAAGEPAAQRTLALRCEVASGDGSADTESTLIVLAPVGGTGTYAEATGDGQTITVDFDSTGVAIVPFPSGAQTVVIQAADGSILDEVPILAP